MMVQVGVTGGNIPHRLVVFQKIHWAYMICPAMSGSGVGTGMIKTVTVNLLETIQKVHQQAPAACTVAVAGTPTRSTCGVPIAAATRRSSGATFSVSASSVRSD